MVGAISLALLFGIMVVIPIGGADMPVVISLLNSYSGLAACAAGFAVNNNILIVAGALVGASGIISNTRTGYNSIESNLSLPETESVTLSLPRVQSRFNIREGTD